MSQRKVSSIPGQQSLLGNGVMNTEANVGTQNLLGSVSSVLTGQIMGQQSLVTTANQTTSTFGPFSYVSEIEKCWFHQQLVFLLHAYICKKRNSLNTEVIGECNSSQCQGMRNVLSHLQVCKAGDACKVQDCAPSRALVLHWENCTEKEWSLCLPLKPASEHRQQQAPVVQTSQAPNPAVLQRTYASLERPLSVSNSEVLESASHIQLPQTSQQRNIRNMLQTSVLGETDSTTQVVCKGEDLQATIKASNALMNTSPDQMCLLVLSVTGTHAPRNVKYWHQCITESVRLTLIIRIIKEILLAMIKKNINRADEAFNSIIQYARRKEAIMYESANSREEYLHLFAKYIFKIQRKE